jgi:osmotically-inducible protein OsmY
MNKRTLMLLFILTGISVPILQGCAGAVAGGAAAGVAVVHDRRSAGAILDDQVIELKVLDRRLENKALMEQTHINATSYNYVLLLTGEAPTEELKNQVSDMLRNIDKVKRMHDEIVVAPQSSVIERSKDSWITANVKSKLFTIEGIEGFDPSRAKVVTERKVVYLMGIVTRQEAEAITDVARRVEGVERVVKIFEYLD